MHSMPWFWTPMLARCTPATLHRHIDADMIVRESHGHVMVHGVRRTPKLVSSMTMSVTRRALA